MFNENLGRSVHFDIEWGYKELSLNVNDSQNVNGNFEASLYYFVYLKILLST